MASNENIKTVPVNPYGGGPSTGLQFPPYYKPTPSVRSRNVDFPYSETIGKDEMRVSFIGSCPIPQRRDQAGTCIMVELGTCSVPGVMRRTSHWHLKRCAKQCESCRGLFTEPRGWFTTLTHRSGGRFCKLSADAWIFRYMTSGGSAHPARRSLPLARPAASTQTY